MKYNTIAHEVAEAMMDMTAFIFVRNYYAICEKEPDKELVNDYVRNAFVNYCEFNGIEAVEEPD